MVRPLEARAAQSSSLGQMVGFRCVCVCVWLMDLWEGRKADIGVCVSEEQSTQVANGRLPQTPGGILWQRAGTAPAGMELNHR